MQLRVPIILLILMVALGWGCGGGAALVADNGDDGGGIETPETPDDPGVPESPDDPGGEDPDDGDTDYVPTNAPLTEDRSVYEPDSLDIKTLNLTVLPTGATLDDVNSDIDPNDEFDPKADVMVLEDGFLFGDDSTEKAAKLSQRGDSARLAQQKSYKVKLDDKTYLWRGHRTLELNKHAYDLTRMRNKLSFDYFKIIPDLTSWRTQFVKLYIDGTYYGLHTLIESPGNISLEMHGLDEDAHLYKAEYFEFQRYADTLLNTDDPSYDQDTFEEILELKGAEDDHTKLLAMLDAVNDLTNDINDVVEDHFNRENLLTWLAVNVLFRNIDTNTQNFFLYSPTTEDGFYFMQWDYDGSWGFYDQPNQAAARTMPRYTHGISNWWNVVLIKRFIKDPDNLSDLTAKMVSLLDNYVTVGRTGEFTTAFRDLIVAEMMELPDLEFLPAIGEFEPEKLAEVNAEIDRLSGLPLANYDEYLNTLERPMPVFIGDPNEDIGGDEVFYWEASHDLQGDGITYDLQISDDTSFDAGHIVHEEPGLATTSASVSGLPAGTYYFRVIIRDDKDPANNWQLPFDQYWDGSEYHDGMKQFTIE